MSISAESEAIELMKYVDDINMEYGGRGNKAVFHSRNQI